MELLAAWSGPSCIGSVAATSPPDNPAGGDFLVAGQGLVQVLSFLERQLGWHLALRLGRLCIVQPLVRWLRRSYRRWGQWLMTGLPR